MDGNCQHLTSKQLTQQTPLNTLVLELKSLTVYTIRKADATAYMFVEANPTTGSKTKLTAGCSHN
jgi:hypothetical protein